MGSKMLGFRVPDDEYEDIEKTAAERGQTTAEFLRKLVDDVLYPSKDKAKGELEDEGVTLSDIVENIDLHEQQITEIDTKLESVKQDVNNRFNVAFSETTKAANDFQLLDDKCEQLEKFINRSIGDWKKIFSDYEMKFRKLHICPDCGASLHMHRFGQENTWHLECVQCGYYSPDYKATIWKDKPGKHPFPVKETGSKQEEKAVKVT